MVDSIGYSVLISDFVAVLKRRKGPLLAAFFLSGMAALLYCLTSPLQYKAEASFRDKAKSSSGIQNEFFLGLALDKHDSEAILAMKSTSLLQQVVEELMWHGSIEEKKEGWPKLALIPKNLLIDWTLFHQEKRVLFDDPSPKLALSYFQYQEENPLAFEIQFLNEESFIIDDPAGPIAGTLGAICHYRGCSFALEKKAALPLTEHPLTEHPFVIQAQNPTIRAEGMSKELYAKPDIDNRNIIRLSLKNSDRKKGALFLNTLMNHYQRFLEKEHFKTAQKQLVYLEQREQEIADRLSESLIKQGEGFSKEIAASGFMDTKKEVEFLSQELASLKNRQYELSLNEKRLKKLLYIPFATFDKLSHRLFDAEIINEWIGQQRMIKEFRDLAEAKLREYPDTFTSPLPQEEGSKFLGLTLLSSKKWIEKMSDECAEVECKKNELALAIGKLDAPGFEISSLSAFIQDPIANECLHKAAELSLALRETANRSNREIERLQEELTIEKTFLASHLRESQNMHIEKALLLQGQSQALWKRILATAETEKIHLEKQIRDFIYSRLSTQEAELDMTRRQESEIKNRIALLPQKWTHQTLFESLLETNRRMVENISTIVESKNISANLEVIQSSPLDIATVPILPQSPRLLLAFVGGGILGTLFASLLITIQALTLKTPISRKNLLVNGYTCFGTIQYNSQDDAFLLTEENLTSFRNMLSAIGEKKAKKVLILTQHPKIYMPLKTLLLEKGEEPLFVLLSKVLLSKTSAERGFSELMNRELSLEEIAKEGVLFQGKKEDPYIVEKMLSSPGNQFFSEAEKRYHPLFFIQPLHIRALSTSYLGLFDLVIIGIHEQTVQEMEALLHSSLRSKLSFFLESN